MNNKNQFSNNLDELIEILADYEHQRWAKWQKYLQSICIKNIDGSLTIPKDKVDRWTRQIETDYCDLSEQEKEADRNGARRLIRILTQGDKNE